jgi:hypothetical protein
MSQQPILPLSTLKQLIDMNITSIPFLWETYLPQQGIGILTGPSDSSKSTFIRLLGYAIAQGQTSFLGKALHLRRGKVLIVATEDGKIPTAAIIRKQNAQDLPEEAQNNIYFHFKPIRNLEELDRTLEALPVDIVILDTWTDSFTDDLNSSIKVRGNLSGFVELADKHECFILGIHHNRKGGEGQSPNKNNVLGSMAIEAYSRVVIDLRPGRENKRLLTIVKGNYVPDSLKNKPVVLDLDVENMRLSLSSEQSGYGFEKSRINETDKEKFFPIVKSLVEGKEEYTQDDIKSYLQDTFPDERTPSKGTINKWVKEIRSGNNSQNNSQSQGSSDKDD